MRAETSCPILNALPPCACVCVLSALWEHKLLERSLSCLPSTSAHRRNPVSTRQVHGLCDHHGEVDIKEGLQTCAFSSHLTLGPSQSLPRGLFSHAGKPHAPSCCKTFVHWSGCCDVPPRSLFGAEGQVPLVTGGAGGR